ncbi:MAG: fibronectin type III domain-containing protein [Clostridia bacterium]|nr:fibronectin type III domain-containing protein [Clostridia bacterium]
MKKLKSIIIFSAVLLTMAVLFCVSASAAEWNEYGVFYTYDEDTEVMVIKGSGRTVRRHTFGETSPYCSSEDGWCECWDFPDGADPTENDLKAYNAVKNAKILIIKDGVNLESGSLGHFRKIETLILPETITVIPDGLCYGCDELKTVVFSSGLTEIGREAFSGCDKLTNITIPKTVKTVKRDAFYAVDTSDFLFPDKIAKVESGNSLYPECVKNVSFTAHSDLVYISWDEAKNATGYRVFVRENGKWKKLADVDPRFGEKCHYTVSKLKSNTSYTIAVRPYNELYGPNNPFYDTTYWCPTYKKMVITTALEDVTAKASSSSSSKIKVSWNNISAETGYQVWISEKQYSGYKKASNYSANTTSATVKNLTSGKTYYVKVRAYKKTADGYNYSEFSAPIKVKVK